MRKEGLKVGIVGLGKMGLVHAGNLNILYTAKVLLEGHGYFGKVQMIGRRGFA